MEQSQTEWVPGHFLSLLLTSLIKQTGIYFGVLSIGLTRRCAISITEFRGVEVAIGFAGYTL